METFGFADVNQFGPPVDGDWTPVIQRALDHSAGVIIPWGQTCQVDGTVQVRRQQALIVAGRLYRSAARTHNTAPLVRLAGEYATLSGMSAMSSLESENDSPDGVVLWGVANPASQTSPSLRWVECDRLQIIANNSPSSKALACQSAQAFGHGGGALYGGTFTRLRLWNAGMGVYLNADVNGNLFSELYFGNVRFAVYADGTTGGASPSAHCSDNNIVNCFVDASPKLVAAIYGRRISHTNFLAINGEPGAGMYTDIDVSSNRVTLVSSQNFASNGRFDAELSTYSVNGKGKV